MQLYFNFNYSEILLMPLLAIFPCLPSHAATYSSGSGLSGSLSLDTNFSDAIASVGVDQRPGDFYPKAMFNEFLLGPSAFGGTGIRTLISSVPSIASSIVLVKPVNGVALLIRAAVPIRITAFLESQQVVSVSTNGEGYDVPTYYGFGGLAVDEIVFSFDSVPSEISERFIGIDQLQLGEIIVPRSVQVPQGWIANLLMALPVASYALFTLHTSGRRSRASRPTPYSSLLVMLRILFSKSLSIWRVFV